MAFPNIISVDDHLIEPPDLWTGQAPASLKHAVPHVVTDPNTGNQHWTYEGKVLPLNGLMTCSGRPKSEWSPVPLPSYDVMPAAYYDPVERCRAMTEDGVLASLAFPSITRFCGQVFYEAKDKPLAMTSLKMYNDWLLDEWAVRSHGRLVPMVIVPLWDPAEAAAEVRRCAAKGAKAVNFSENPYDLGLPSIHDRNGYWDPLWDAVNEIGIPVCMHIGSSSHVIKTAPDAPFLVQSTLVSLNSQKALADWLFSGIFVRYPNINIALSEGGIGWIPFILERAEWVLDRQRWALKTNVTYEGEAITERDLTDWVASPRELFKNHVYGCVIDDQHGIDSIDIIGEDRLLLETDYPHSDSTWPDSQKMVEKRLAHLSAETRDKLMFGNAAKLFNLDVEALKAAVGATA